MDNKFQYQLQLYFLGIKLLEKRIYEIQTGNVSNSLKHIVTTLKTIVACKRMIILITITNKITLIL